MAGDADGVLAVLNGLITGINSGLENRRKRATEAEEFELKKEEMVLKRQDVRAQRESNELFKRAQLGQRTTESSRSAGISGYDKVDEATTKLNNLESELADYEGLSGEANQKRAALLKTQVARQQAIVDGLTKIADPKAGAASTGVIKPGSRVAQTPSVDPLILQGINNAKNKKEAAEFLLKKIGPKNLKDPSNPYVKAALAKFPGE